MVPCCSSWGCLWEFCLRKEEESHSCINTSVYAGLNASGVEKAASFLRVGDKDQGSVRDLIIFLFLPLSTICMQYDGGCIQLYVVWCNDMNVQYALLNLIKIILLKKLWPLNTWNDLNVEFGCVVKRFHIFMEYLFSTCGWLLQRLPVRQINNIVS